MSAVRDFSDEVVLVTGAAGGIGRAIVAAFVERGAAVAVADLSLESAASACAEIGAVVAGARLAPFQVDVASEPDYLRVVSEVVEQFGRLDHLVNNAGTLAIGAIVDTPLDEWNRVMSVNTTGVFLGIKVVAPHLLAQGRGTITNIASLVGKSGSAQIAAYCASKAAVISLTQSAARELAPAVRVNSVCPGVLDTPMQQLEYEVMARESGRTPDEIRQEWIDAIPMGALQEPLDVAEAVVFLASQAARNITGEAMNVNGGWLMD